MTTLGMATFLLDIGRSLREAFFMFWETLWALVLGFTLSGVVQAFISKETMQQQLGTRRPLAIITLQEGCQLHYFNCLHGGRDQLGR